MTSLAFYSTHIHVLGVVEVSQVRKVVNADPFDGFIIFRGRHDLSDFNFACQATLFDLIVAVHTNVDRRDRSVLPFRSAHVTIFTVNFVLPCMDFMREGNWLFWSVTLLYTNAE